MIIDFNTYLGHYPFRPIRNNDAQSLELLLKEHEIDKALVSSVSGIYYRDVMKGNIELIESIKKYSDTFIPVCNINPVYADAENDFMLCAKELGFKGIKLFPRQHGYELFCPQAVKIMNLASENGMFVQLPIYIEDLRQRHFLDIEEPVDADEINKAVMLAPDTDFVLSNYSFEGYAKVIENRNIKGKGNIYYDISRMDCLKNDMLGRMINDYSSEKLLFATGAPLEYIDVQLVKIKCLPETSGCGTDDVENICYRNASKIISRTMKVL